MSGRDKMMSFDEHELQKERKKRHIEQKKEKDPNDNEFLRMPHQKPKKVKLSHRFTDFDSEDWYE